MEEVTLEAPIPHDESARLSALRSYCILDSPGEGYFARIIADLQCAFRTTIAAVYLVDAERQWSKASSGIAAGSMPRSIAFCSYTILANEPLVVFDARKDVRFADNPLVISHPFIRFYAGAPLIDRDGYRIGAVCIADKECRSMTASQRDQLAQISVRAMQHIELHQLREAEESNLEMSILSRADAAQGAGDKATAFRFIDLARAFFDEEEYEQREPR